MKKNKKFSGEEKIIKLLFLFLQEFWSASIVKNKKFSEEEKIIELLFLFLQEYWSASVVKK
jgi:hypothetical protein